MVVGMDPPVLAPPPPQEFFGPVGQHLVGVHVGRRAAASVKAMNREMGESPLADQLSSCLNYGSGDLCVQVPPPSGWPRQPPT